MVADACPSGNSYFPFALLLQLHQDSSVDLVFIQQDLESEGYVLFLYKLFTVNLLHCMEKYLIMQPSCWSW